MSYQKFFLPLQRCLSLLKVHKTQEQICFYTLCSSCPFAGTDKGASVPPNEIKSGLNNLLLALTGKLSKAQEHKLPLKAPKISVKVRSASG